MAYEELRRTALEEANGSVRRAPPGLVLVLRGGLAAWMQACRSVAGPMPPALPTGETTRELPRGVRAEVTVLLTEMALAAAAEIVR